MNRVIDAEWSIVEETESDECVCWYGLFGYILLPALGRIVVIGISLIVISIIISVITLISIIILIDIIILVASEVLI